MAEEVSKVANPTIEPQPGSAGVKTQVNGQAVTVSAGAAATGGIASGHLFDSALDENLFKFKSDDTPLMQMMLFAKSVSVDSPIVQHYMIDEPKYNVTLLTAVTKNTEQETFTLDLSAAERKIPAAYGTLLVKGVNGYTQDGQTEMPGQDLMLFVTGHDSANKPVVMCVNGPRKTKTDQYCYTPAIPAGTEMVVLSNACYETQKEVDPDMVIPQPTELYLQKRVMNQIISDYFDHQKKRIPFNNAIIAEQMLTNFKTRNNRTLWAGQQGMFQVMGKNGTGQQTVFCTKGVRWQFKREMQHKGKWTVEQFIALAKMFYTGEDVPATGIILAGKNFLENVQCIDYSKHPEIQISTKFNPLGWEVTNIHTVFGDLQIKREPTLDRLGWSNSAAVFGMNRLVHYKYTNEHEFNEDVQGEEAKRKGVIMWDGLGLKGACHIWIDGEGEKSNEGAVVFEMWDSESAPATTASTKSHVFYLLSDCPGISKSAKTGTMWQYDGKAWAEYTGEFVASAS